MLPVQERATLFEMDIIAVFGIKFDSLDGVKLVYVNRVERSLERMGLIPVPGFVVRLLLLVLRAVVEATCIFSTIFVYIKFSKQEYKNI